MAAVRSRVHLRKKRQTKAEISVCGFEKKRKHKAETDKGTAHELPRHHVQYTASNLVQLSKSHKDDPTPFGRIHVWHTTRIGSMLYSTLHAETVVVSLIVFLVSGSHSRPSVLRQAYRERASASRQATTGGQGPAPSGWKTLRFLANSIIKTKNQNKKKGNRDNQFVGGG